MLTYQGDPAVKATFQARFAAHRAADEVIQGTGFEAGRGCFIGCTMNEYGHESFASQIGPEWLAHLADTIFEGLPKAEAPQFGTDLLAAIPVGVPYETVGKIRFVIAIARHKSQIVRLEGNTEPYADQVCKALQGVIHYCEQMIKGIPASAWSARSAARSAAWSAAWSAESAESAESAAAWSAESAAESAAAWSAESAAESAAWSAAAESARSAARSAAWSAESAESAESEYQIERDTLLAALRAL